MADIFSIACLAIALLALPAAYIVLCFKMGVERSERAPYFSAFILFGNIGGWVLAFGLSPSGLAATSLIFLMLIAFPALVISTIILLCRKNRSWYQEYVMIGGIMFPIAMGWLFGVVTLAGAFFDH